jgi:3-isopropylmalate/(R)-2-methylmalate dehydratase small subunit
LAHELHGRVWLLPDDIDTGQILPHATFTDLRDVDPRELLFSELRPGLAEKLRPGDILWAGRNFGQGSSREDAPRLIKDVGIRLVLAVDFARIFYRNAINIGLSVAMGDPRDTRDGDQLQVNLVSGVVQNLTRETKLQVEPLPSTIRPILAEGGLIPHLRKHGRLAPEDSRARRAE